MRFAIIEKMEKLEKLYMDNESWGTKCELSSEIMNDMIEVGIAPRYCSKCGEPMWSGYYAGDEYYCNVDCLDKDFSKEQWEEEYDDGEGQSCWTEWEVGDMEIEEVRCMLKERVGA